MSDSYFGTDEIIKPAYRLVFNSDCGLDAVNKLNRRFKSICAESDKKSYATMVDHRTLEVYGSYPELDEKGVNYILRKFSGKKVESWEK